jgi:hypothetical protein
VPKIVDWVVTPSTKQTKIDLPADCQEKVKEICEKGGALEVKIEAKCFNPCTPVHDSNCPNQCKVIKIDPVTIDVDCTQVDVSVVCLTYSVTVCVYIYEADSDCVLECEGSDHREPICKFEKCIPLWDKVALCLPEPLGKENIFVRVIDVEASCAGVFVGETLDLELFICKEVMVECLTKLEVCARFAQPRGPIDLPQVEKKRCLPLVRQPKSCGLFPIERCECQALVCSQNTNQLVSLEECPGSTGPSQEYGDLFINADICPVDNPAGSFLMVKFDDLTGDSEIGNYYPGDQSFCLKADGDHIGMPVCKRLATDATQLVVTINGKGLYRSKANGWRKESANFIIKFTGTPEGSSGVYSVEVDNGVDCIFYAENVPVNSSTGKFFVDSCAALSTLPTTTTTIP